jgi:hypothetical protein
MKDTMRTSNDGTVYAGRSLHDEEGRIINDISMTPADSVQHFMVKYNFETKEFNIVDLSSESGTFVKIVKPFTLWTNCIISIGDSHVTIKIEDFKINLLFIGGPRKGDSMSFDGRSDPELLIGRMAS